MIIKSIKHSQEKSLLQKMRVKHALVAQFVLLLLAAKTQASLPQEDGSGLRASDDTDTSQPNRASNRTTLSFVHVPSEQLSNLRLHLKGIEYTLQHSQGAAAILSLDGSVSLELNTIKAPMEAYLVDPTTGERHFQGMVGAPGFERTASGITFHPESDLAQWYNWGNTIKQCPDGTDVTDYSQCSTWRNW